VAAAAAAVAGRLQTTSFSVASVERKPYKRSPYAPFRTTTLQQEASRKLYFSPSRTMKIAQKLYEGVELGDQGAVGLITYMRTDSPRVSDDALASVRTYIDGRYGKDYLPEKPNFYRSAKSAQEAHEAIRPTAVERDPESIARCLGKDELALYTLIFNRFVSSQISQAVYDRTSVDIEADGAVFRAIDVFDHAKQGRGVGEMRHLGQKAQNLDLGIFAGLQPVMDFQHHLVGDDERGIALSGANAMDIGRLDHGFGIETGRR